MQEAGTKNIKLMTAMARAQMSGRSLAARCGLSSVTISHVLNRKAKPRRQTIRQIAKALDSTPSELGIDREGAAA